MDVAEDVAEADLRLAFESDGYAILPALLSNTECDELIDAIQASHETRRPGSRRWLRVEVVANVARLLRTHPAISVLLASDARAVQCTLFAKDPDTNWSVTPHQDLSVPVRERVDADGWSAWCAKEGMTFAQPPSSVLERLLAVRLQLDDGDAAAGPLEVVPGSHRVGRRSAAEISRLASITRVSCPVPRGGALIMRPLLIHASGRMQGEGRRRVLHFLYGPPLDGSVSWADAI